MTQSHPQFVHLRRFDSRTGDVSPLGGVTLAVEDDSKGGVRVGIAVCHEKDHFVKKEGRARAAGRMRSTSADHEKFRVQFPDVTADELLSMMYGNRPKRAEMIPAMQQALDRAGAGPLCRR